MMVIDVSFWEDHATHLLRDTFAAWQYIAVTGIHCYGIEQGSGREKGVGKKGK